MTPHHLVVMRIAPLVSPGLLRRFRAFGRNATAILTDTPAAVTCGGPVLAILLRGPMPGHRVRRSLRAEAASQ